VLVLDHGKLIYGEKFVVLRLSVIEHADQIAANRAIGSLILNRHALDQILVDDVVVDHQ